VPESVCVSRHVYFFVSHCLASMSPVIGEMEPPGFFYTEMANGDFGRVG
jgi:hypothetical protein